MIGREDFSEEEPVMKVLDKRKFNVDGSVREGVKIQAEQPKEPKKEEVPIDESNRQTVETDNEAAVAKQAETAALEGEEMFEEDDFPGADDPASFVNFLSTLASQAAASLGAMPHPATGQRTVDLETGKYWIDVLAMLSEKTEGNLHAQEKRLFEGLLSDLRMQFVALTRATEEKLKQQAAQKFSAKDILGKK
ncbi:MAG: DUF1844 domain-containing protein [Acidobacteriota bacterium]|jgi:hypothetical protein|nr:DUF1844 domain-containing protein [Acidobacteriota bacterium]MDQ3372748.1 DUF1844 domain-containing protein [Acidobacteriota bacterium]